jgi:hypothetical protein
MWPKGIMRADLPRNARNQLSICQRLATRATADVGHPAVDKRGIVFGESTMPADDQRVTLLLDGLANRA